MRTYERIDNELATKDDRIAELERENAALREEKRQWEAFRDYVQKFGDYWKAFERRAAIDAARKEQP